MKIFGYMCMFTLIGVGILNLVYAAPHLEKMENCSYINQDTRN